MNTQQVSDYIEENKTAILLWLLVFIVVFVVLYVTGRERQKTIDEINYHHQEQIKHIKYWSCNDLWDKVWEFKSKRIDIIQQIEEKKVELVKAQNYNKYFWNTLSTAYLDETITRLEIDVEDIEKRSKKTREEISRCDTRPERRLSSLLGNM